jgi:hypothetical protein
VVLRARVIVISIQDSTSSRCCLAAAVAAASAIFMHLCTCTCVLPFCSASMLHYVCIYDQLIGHYTWFLVHVTRSLKCKSRNFPTTTIPPMLRALNCAAFCVLWRSMDGGCCGTMVPACFSVWYVKAGAGGCDWRCVWPMLLCGLCFLCLLLWPGLDYVTSMRLYALLLWQIVALCFASMANRGFASVVNRSL